MAQRSAFAEDAARIRAALAAGSSTAAAESTEAAASPVASLTTGSRHEPLPDDSPQKQQPPDDSDDDESGGGGWLSNYTAHHTRVGEAYQVSSLPVPPDASSSSVTHVSKEEEASAAAE